MAMALTALISTPLTAADGATSLSVQPSIIVVPLTDLEQGATLVAAEIHLNNVQDLKDFELTIAFDGRLLEFFDLLSGETWNLSGSGGYNPGRSSLTINRTLRDVASGSGHLYTLWFRPIGIGSAHIQIVTSDLVDSGGCYIPHTIVGNAAEVQIVTLATWVDGEYAELKVEFDDLQEDYSLLQSTYDGLNAAYGELQSDHDKLQSDYDELGSELESTVNLLETKLYELNLKEKLLYGFVGVTVVLVAAVGYLLHRRARTG